MAPVESPTRDPTTALEEDDFDEDIGPAIMDDYDDDDNDNEDDNAMNQADDFTAGLTGLVGDDNNDDEPGLDETTMLSRTADLTERLLATAASDSRNSHKRKKPGKKISKHGIEYKSLPQGVIKRLATTFTRTAGGVGSAKISPDALAAVTQATDWFFEQLADDLQAYAQHAGRKTIDESDMVTLMRRYVVTLPPYLLPAFTSLHSVVFSLHFNRVYGWVASVCFHMQIVQRYLQSFSPPSSRQRQTSASTTPFALAQRHLPRELLQELRMPVPAPTKAPRKKARRVEVNDEEDAT